MLSSLEKAFAEAARLPSEEQQWLADFILEEIAAERRWDDLLARPNPALDRLIHDALAEDDADETLPLDPDSL
jgi:hypothetical protein